MIYILENTELLDILLKIISVDDSEITEEMYFLKCEALCIFNNFSVYSESVETILIQEHENG